MEQEGGMTPSELENVNWHIKAGKCIDSGTTLMPREAQPRPWLEFKKLGVVFGQPGETQLNFSLRVMPGSEGLEL